MSTKLFAITTAAALCAGGFTTLQLHAAGSPAAEHRGPGRGALLERAREKLGLSESQVQQIRQAIYGERENIVSLAKRMRDAREELRTAIHADAATETAVRAASAKVAAVEADAAVERMKLFHQISPILTADQREKLGEMQERLGGFIDNAVSRLEERLGDQN